QKANERLHEQAGSDEEDHGGCHLANDQDGAETSLSCAVRLAARAFLDCAGDMKARKLQDRHKAEKQCAKSGGDGGEDENSGIQVSLFQARNGCGSETHEQANSPLREQDGESAAEKSQREMFDSELLNETEAAGAEGGTNGDFALTRGRTRKDEAG